MSTSTSPFELFRRNLKPLMVFLTALALFAFVVLPVLDTYMRRGMGGGGDQVVARFEGTELTRTRVEYFTRNHNSTVRFMMELAQETISRGGVPRTAGFQFDTQNNQVRSIGINQSPSIEGTIRSFLFAAEATKAGFDLDDSTLQVWLERYTDGMISNSDIDGMLMASTQNQMGRPHLYEQLRTHLLSSVFLNRGYAGLFMGEGPMSGPLMTPEEQWSNFLKLNRKAVISSYGVLVNDYVDETNSSPSEAEVAETYEEGKDRDFNDQSPEPAFHRRYSASFTYLVGNYQNFLDQEVAKLSEEVLRTEYEKRLKGGEFQLPETAASEMLEDAEKAEAAADPSEPAKATEPSEDKPAASKPDEAADKTTDTDSEDATPEATDKDPEAAPQESTAESTEEPAEEPANDEAATDSESEKEDAGNDQSNISRPAAVRLVAFQEDDNDSDEAGQEEAESEPGTEDEPASKDGDDGKAEDEPEEVDEKKDVPDSDDEKSDAPEEEPDPDSGRPADEKPEEKKVESFEDVRESIASDLAGPAARARMDAAISEVTKTMSRYFTDRSIYQNDVKIGKKVVPAPTEPDLMSLGETLGLSYEVIGPYSELTIADEPIANSFEVGTQFGRRGPSFAVMMYGFDNGQTVLPRQELYSPVRTADDPAGKIYVSWKTSETEAYTPTLDEVRGEVVMAVRMKEARKLAQEAAEKLAKQASEAGDKPLVDLVAEDKRENFQAGLGPFSWMDSFGFQGATIGNVPELDSVGPAFMEAVFNSAVGQYSAAPNQPGRVVYVVTPTKFEPSLDELRRQFKQPTNRMMAMMVGNDAGQIINDFYESVDKKSGFTSFLEEE